MGKIYGGLLILENWKATKFGKVVPMDGQVQNQNNDSAIYSDDVQRQ